MARVGENFAETYSKMSDDDLIRLYAERASLIPEAVSSLGAEVQKRQLKVSNDYAPSSPSFDEQRRLAAKPIKIFAGVLCAAYVLINSVPFVWHRFEIRKYLAESRKLQQPNREFREHLGEILHRKPETFFEFQTQANELEDLLNSGNEIMKQNSALIMKAKTVFSVQANSLMQRAADDNAKIFAVLREEIACSRALSKASANKQSGFGNTCIEPANEKLQPLIEDGDAAMREFQKQGAKLPEEESFQ
jgi:hypothetical protein